MTHEGIDGIIDRLHREIKELHRLSRDAYMHGLDDGKAEIERLRAENEDMHRALVEARKELDRIRRYGTKGWGE